MKIAIILLTLITLFVPIFAFADCNWDNSTVIYVNGVFGNEADARADKDSLEKKFKNLTKRSDVAFLTGFNESHVGGVGDIVKAVKQAYGMNLRDYDLTNILRQIHGDLTTQKILLVGHSQGTFYTNAAYDYFVNNGVPKESIGVYNVATPADIVAGHGNYLTSSTDKVINLVVRELTKIGFAFQPLPANIDLKLSAEEQASAIGGHSFSNVYLAQAPDKIIKDIDNALNNLKAGNFTPGSECFAEPEINFVYKVQDASFKNIDQSIAYFGETTTSNFKSPEEAAKLAEDLFRKIYNLSRDFALASKDVFAKLGKNVFITATLPGYTVQESDSLQNNLTFVPPSIPAVTLDFADFNGTGGPVETQLTQTDRQDLLDDIQERIDVLNQEVQKLIEQQNFNNENENQQDDQDKTDGQDNKEDDNKNKDDGNKDQQQNPGNTNTGGMEKTYSVVLISEVQLAGLTDAKQEFVELYNPNNHEVDLTNWYLQKKTAGSQNWSSYASKTLFSDKKIPANGYFLIARDGYYQNYGDIFVDSSVTDDNSFALKNPNGEISDKLGFGNAQDPELTATQNPGAGQSVGRKVLADGTEEETNNNFNDFELQNITPKSKNTPYSEPPPPILKDKKAPNVSFTLDETQYNLSFAVNFNITDPFSAVSPSGAGSYVFRWQENGAETWQEDASVNILGSPASVDQKRDFTGEDGKTYNFQVKAKDTVGNESDWQPETPAVTKIVIPKKILINEIQLGGKTADDEFIELYNPNNVDVDLTGFSLKKKISSATESNLVGYASFVGTIAKNGYFLIVPQKNEDNSEKYTGAVAPDLRYSGTSFYISANNTILIYNENNILLDKVGLGTAQDFETTATTNPADLKSVERKGIGLDTDNNLADFRISDNPTPKASFMQAGIQDATNYLNNFGSNNGANYYNLLLKWSSKSPNLDFFQVQYKANDNDWKDWKAVTIETQGNFSAYYTELLDKNVYSFRVLAQDKDGNKSDWSQIDVDVSAPVVINEVALYGTTASQNDQWIELYNKTDANIDLTGWKIKANGATLTLSGAILAKGYFILEKGNDGDIAGITANQIFTENLIGGSFSLYNSSQRFVDQIYNGGWGKGEYVKDGKAYTIERLSAYALGIETKNWKINDGTIINGTDRNANPIYGTPGSQNSRFQMYTVIQTTFAENISIKKDLNPYLSVTPMNILKDVILTIEPGVIVKFYDNYSTMTIDGTLKAVGGETDENKIIFTSSFDGEYGGDTNPNGDGRPANPGEWPGIKFTLNSQNSELDNVFIRYAGAFLGDDWRGSVKVDRSKISLKNSTIYKGNNIALDLINSDSIIDNVKFLETKGEGKTAHIEAGSPQISNSYFYDNYYGVYISSWYDPVNKVEVKATPTIENNNFVQNEAPIYMSKNCYPVLSGNTASENQFNAIIFYPTEMSENIELRPDLPYLLKGVINVPAGKTLTLNPGVIMDFQDNWAGLQIDGTLKAIGTTDLPITFRPYYYDKDWVQPGNWLGLDFEKTSVNSELDNIKISLAGACYGNCGNEVFKSAIKVNQCNVSFKNSFVENNLGTGLWMINSASIVDNVKFNSHKKANAGLPGKAVFIEGGTPEIKNSSFTSQTYGIYKKDWTNPATHELVLVNPNLHTADPEDSQKNSFIDTDIPGGEIYTAP